MKSGQWTGSTDGVSYSVGLYDSKKEAIEKIPHDAELEKGSKYWVGQLKIWTPELDVDDVLNGLVEKIYYFNGNPKWDILYSVPKVFKEELGEALNEVLAAWLGRYVINTDFSTIENCEEFVVRDDMIEEAAK